MSDRDAYVDKMKAKLDEWNAEIGKMEAKSRQAEADMRLKYDEQLKKLRARRDEAEAQLKELQKASEDSWHRMRKGMDEAWDDMSRAFREAMERFRS